LAFIGPWEIALILAIVLIIFGPKKLPQLAKSIGDAIKQYREASEGRTPSPTVSTPSTSKTNETGALIQTAKNLGINTEGKTMEQISKEIEEIASKAKSKPSKKKTSSKSK
jgi:sec-independent protein translocase protein TatA